MSYFINNYNTNKVLCLDLVLPPLAAWPQSQEPAATARSCRPGTHSLQIARQDPIKIHFVVCYVIRGES